MHHVRNGQYADEQDIARLKEEWHGRLCIFALSYIQDVHDAQMQSEYNFLLANQYALEDESIKIITNNQIKEALSNALAKLPEQTRNVFVMSKLNGHKHKEIAEELVISVKTVEYHISRAFVLLRKEM